MEEEERFDAEQRNTEQVEMDGEGHVFLKRLPHYTVVKQC